MLALPVFVSSLFIYLFLSPLWWLKANRNGMTGRDDLQRQGSAGQTQRLRSSLPKLCLLTEPCHCARRGFCIFAGELGTCSEHHVRQGDTITVTAPSPLNPHGHHRLVHERHRDSSAINWCGANIYKPDPARHWATLICAQHLRSMGSTRVHLAFLGNKTSEFHTLVALFEQLTPREEPFTSSKGVLAVPVSCKHEAVFGRQAFPDKVSLLSHCYQPAEGMN